MMETAGRTCKIIKTSINPLCNNNSLTFIWHNNYDINDMCVMFERGKQ